MTKRRCSGHCCRKFYLPVKSAEELLRRYGHAKDVEYIADMIIKLPPQDTAADGRPLDADSPLREHWFTCKHHDAATGDCKAYDQRPAMCRDYPYEEPCKYQDCTSSCNEELARSRDGLLRKLGVEPKYIKPCAFLPKLKLAHEKETLECPKST